MKPFAGLLRKLLGRGAIDAASDPAACFVGIADFGRAGGVGAAQLVRPGRTGTCLLDEPLLHRLAQAVSPSPARPLQAINKADAVTETILRMAGLGWLPVCLRTAWLAGDAHRRPVHTGLLQGD